MNAAEDLYLTKLEDEAIAKVPPCPDCGQPNARGLHDDEACEEASC